MTLRNNQTTCQLIFFGRADTKNLPNNQITNKKLAKPYEIQAFEAANYTMLHTRDSTLLSHIKLSIASTFSSTSESHGYYTQRAPSTVLYKGGAPKLSTNSSILRHQCFLPSNYERPTSKQSKIVTEMLTFPRYHDLDASSRIVLDQSQAVLGTH